MIIPREHISTDQYLTRLHAQIKDEIPVESTDPGIPVAREKSRGKKNTEVDWWAACESYFFNE
ncbi:uncharacterized protein EAE97_007740 [Botrytis byssoidea]|uniref:Uncharacterized protein n=1 Tax=Botrytis byssoidea TaxID=139641 RepID=A0A9P5ILY3_9HELO|nr:uncharacterized protein EAE97_007740 [Botrytis byssoidea]KAF7937944.1 hypothetical protein EAE97_007740 [Botrytis byssoidea]